MRCTFHGNGVITCGSSRNRPKCSTPGCGRAAGKVCDHPIVRAASSEPAPKRGDCRLHLTHRVLFFVWSVDLDGEGSVRISQKDPGLSLSTGAVQTVPFSRWFEVSAPTCSRPVCDRCAVPDGELEYCGAHARERAAQRQLPPKEGT